jgi:hypothetical protein
MASNNAALVAHKVAEDIGKGKLINLGKIMRETGYKKSTSLTPQRVTNTKTYKKLAIPLIDGLQEEITRIKKAMAEKNLANEDYRVLIYALDTATKNYQLLSGGATERQVFVMPSEIMEKNIIEAVETPKLNDGSIKPL